MVPSIVVVAIHSAALCAVAAAPASALALLCSLRARPLRPGVIRAANGAPQPQVPVAPASSC
jgi:hypothetical protein